MLVTVDHLGSLDTLLGPANNSGVIIANYDNVTTGAADGYARMAGKPAFTLLHVGSGFANGTPRFALPKLPMSAPISSQR